MKRMKDMLESIGIKEFMTGLDLPEKGSSRGYESIPIIECFWSSICRAAYRQQAKNRFTTFSFPSTSAIDHLVVI